MIDFEDLVKQLQGDKAMVPAPHDPLISQLKVRPLSDQAAKAILELLSLRRSLENERDHWRAIAEIRASP